MGVPVYHGDFYSDDFILNPTQGYADLRALGPVIWMEQQNAYAVTCYNEVVHVLRNPATFISGNGISMNDDVNALLKGSTVNSDGDEHDSRRRVTKLLNPDEPWEGFGKDPVKSAEGSARGWIPELRDPCLFYDEERLWLLYSGGGERGIGVAEMIGF